MTVQVEYPPWVTKSPKKDQRKLKQKFLLRIAAAYHNPMASMDQLGIALGYAPGSLATIVNMGTISPELCVKLEKLLGKENFSRHLLRPDIFEAPKE